jgi:hypothetical protein
MTPMDEKLAATHEKLAVMDDGLTRIEALLERIASK